MVEMLVAAGVFALLLGAIANTVQHGNQAYRQGVANAVVEGQCRRMLERIAAEFGDVDRSSLNPNPTGLFWTAAIDYARANGFAAGALQVGPTRRLLLALETGELDNGLDDNGNGLIDERRVLLVPDTATPAERVSLGSQVRELAEGELPNGLDDNGNGIADEAGLWFRHDGSGTLTVSLSLERLDGRGGSIVRTLTTSVRMRND